MCLSGSVWVTKQTHELTIISSYVDKIILTHSPRRIDVVYIRAQLSWSCRHGDNWESSIWDPAMWLKPGKKLISEPWVRYFVRLLFPKLRIKYFSRLFIYLFCDIIFDFLFCDYADWLTLYVRPLIVFTYLLKWRCSTFSCPTRLECSVLLVFPVLSRTSQLQSLTSPRPFLPGLSHFNSLSVCSLNPSTSAFCFMRYCHKILIHVTATATLDSWLHNAANRL